MYITIVGIFREILDFIVYSCIIVRFRFIVGIMIIISKKIIISNIIYVIRILIIKFSFGKNVNISIGII